MTLQSLDFSCCSSHRLTKSLCEQLLAVSFASCYREWVQQEMPVEMDGHFLQLKLNAGAKSSLKQKISSKCVEQAVLEVILIILMLL